MPVQVFFDRDSYPVFPTLLFYAALCMRPYENMYTINKVLKKELVPAGKESVRWKYRCRILAVLLQINT